MLLRRALHARGLRYRVHVPIGGGLVADAVFGPPKVALFVDGCFWHACPKHGRLPHPGPNYDRWLQKLQRVKQREEEAFRILSAKNYVTLRVWECDIRADAVSAARIVEDCVRQRRSSRALSDPGIRVTTYFAEPRRLSQYSGRKRKASPR